MANSLLDFVMSLVRDSDAAARYAADPAAAIAAADLPDVTSADVDQLIPVVAESLSSAVPAMPAMDANVWTSGAATAAFDAFDIDDAVPVVAHDLDDFSVREVVTTLPEPDQSLVPTTVGQLDSFEEYADIPVVDDVPAHQDVIDQHAVDQAWTAPDAAGFDIFD